MTTRLNPAVAFVFAVLALSVPVHARIVINEIHYDPEPKTEPVEFVELYNSGSESVDLTGWYFSQGIDYVFPAESTIEADGFLILAQNVGAYDAKFGSIFVGGLKASGEFGGKLANSGERLVLRNAAGETVDEVNFKARFPWPVTPQGEPVTDGNGVSMELLNPALDNNLGGHWRPAMVAPTPGKTNSVHTELAEAPPAVRQVSHTPQSPVTGDPVVITARVTDGEGVSSVVLRYQHVTPGDYIRLDDEEYQTTWTEIAMRDDGTAPDVMANDSIYSVDLPDSVVMHRHLLRYRIVATDNGGNSIRTPHLDDPQPNFALFTYDGVPAWTGSFEPGAEGDITYSEEVMRSVPAYHIIANNDDIEDQQWNQGARNRIFTGTLCYDGEVYDHFKYSTRGQFSTYQVGKNKWDFDFLRGHRFQARDNYGKKYPVEWKEINVLPGTNPWWGDNVSTDGTILNEPLGFRIHQLAGGTASNTSYFQMRIIDGENEAPGNQYDGDLWGLYIAIQDPDNRFLEERGLPDGNIYNAKGGTYGHKNQGATQVDDLSDIRAFEGSGAEGFHSTHPVEWWNERLNYRAYFAFNCCNLAINNSDMRPGSNMMFYHHPDGQWYTLPWDLDLTFETAPHLGRGDTSDWERIYRVLEHDEVDAAYQSRARELLGLLFNGEQASMLVDELARFVWVDVPADDILAVTSVTRSGVTVTVETEEPHGFTTGDSVIIDGATVSQYNGTKTITALSDTSFSYTISLFAPNSTEGDIVAYRAPDQLPFVDVDRAMWDHHPEKRKPGIYFKNIDGIETEDFGGYVRYLKKFLAPSGYGHELLKSHVEDAVAPEAPEIVSIGDSAFPIDGLRFSVSEFKSGGGIFVPQEFAALQWRIAEVTDVTHPDYDPSVPRKYEVEPDWESEELPYAAEFVFPADIARVDRTYRVRARMKNTDGHWGYWSDPVQFVTTAPDLSQWQDNLRITEINYHPAAPTEAERAAGYEESDFEFIELQNTGNTVLDMSQLRFTKGINFDLATGTIQSLEPGAVMVVTRNVDAFTLRYGDGLPVTGGFGPWNLSNGGENLKLSFGAGAGIIEFAYDDEDGWPDADGNGSTLEFTGGNPALPTSWIASAQNGSPGTVEPVMGLTYTQWREASFDPAAAADDSVSGPEADPDGDGQVNTVEYALGGNPTTGDPKPLSVTVDWSEPTAILVYPVRTNATDLEVSIEFSSDLQTWESDNNFTEESQENVSDGVVEKTMKGGIVLSGESFYRLKIILR